MMKLANLPAIERWITLSNTINTVKTVFEKKKNPCLIAVSKMHPAEAILPLLQAGQKDYGENRVQEASLKWKELKAAFPDTRLHLIGPLQTNKVLQALSLFDCFHTIDRKGLVDAFVKHRDLWRHCAKRFLIQVNIGAEPQKSGVSIAELADLVDYCRNRELPVCGLMCIPPAGEPPAPYFALLHTLAARHGLPELSMGMSDDFETAIRLGATCVRIGTALFGERQG